MPRSRLAPIGLLLVLSACSASHDMFSGNYDAPPPPEKEVSIDPSGTVNDRLGVVAGANVSGPIGRYLSSQDRTLLEEATQNALENNPSGIAMKWRNNATGASGTVTPQPAFDMDGKPCREFQQQITASGQLATGYGTACRDRGGVWRIAENG